jgi:hypothetical protein
LELTNELRLAITKGNGPPIENNFSSGFLYLPNFGTHAALILRIRIGEKEYFHASSLFSVE